MTQGNAAVSERMPEHRQDAPASQANKVAFEIVNPPIQDRLKFYNVCTSQGGCK